MAALEVLYFVVGVLAVVVLMLLMRVRLHTQPQVNDGVPQQQAIAEATLAAARQAAWDAAWARRLSARPIYQPLYRPRYHYRRRHHRPCKSCVTETPIVHNEMEGNAAVYDNVVYDNAVDDAVYDEVDDEVIE